MRRFIGIAAIAVTTISAPAAVIAGSYPTPNASITLSDTSADHGQPITFNVSNLQPSSTFQVTATPTSTAASLALAAGTMVLGSSTTDTAGAGSITVTPSNLLSPGSYSVCVSGTSASGAAVETCSAMALAAPVTPTTTTIAPTTTVAPGTPVTTVSPNALPATGSSNSQRTALAALALVIAGALTVVVSRRRVSLR